MKHKGRVLLGLILGVAVLAAFTLAYAATKAKSDRSHVVL